MSPSLLLALATGIGVAAASGLRAFLPLLALGIAGRAGLIHLKPESAWLEGNLALVALAVATVLEILADKVPAVDHALDLVATLVRPLAACLGAYAVLVDWPAPWSQLAALVLGTGALAVHVLKSKVRLGSSVTTMGHANPILSAGEDVSAATLLTLAILAPLIVLVATALLIGFLLARRRRTRDARA